ncbi:hypothetical protein [Streptomyces antimicrobicus]|uniref:Uncharacterized protein n=1 Tax=Streptomyces antimicrobicus TaxID=2883108 RepID=A0ABS8B276_9ACTN|nr:hypothetical protein [Streptomyces antimicrobicus]MCB5178720.1 hypothetical protein [Streptomyces antimicrobicus]
MPADDDQPDVGDEPGRTDQASWEAAVRHLYEDAYAYVATGPRRHEDWRLDVLAVMSRSVPDPRGWAGLDDEAENPERSARPAYPFRDLTPEYLAERLHEIDRSSAEDLLLALTDDGCTLSNLERFPESPTELRAMARTVLARYGDAYSCHTNVRRAGAGSEGALDFTVSDWSYSPLSVYTEDSGLVVVSAAEVGLFWNFADY